MKTYKFCLLLIIGFIYLVSCSKDKDNNNVTLTNDYLPLEIGNYWQMDYLERKEIVETKVIGNKTFYALKYNNDTTYLRLENNKVYAIEHTDKESIKFDLSANVNDTWKFNSWTVKLTSKTDTIIINNKKISNCYQFFFDFPGMIDDEHSVWLAPGIGFVQEQCGECLHQIRKLDKAKIMGQELDY